MVENFTVNIDNPEQYELCFESMFIRTEGGKEKFVELPSFFGDFREQPMTLKDVSDKYGTDYGVITLYCETYTSGAVFRYNNYGKQEWIQIGKLAGFA